ARDPVKDAATIVMDDPHPAMDRASTNDIAAKSRVNHLVAQANAQDRHLTSQLPDDSQADPGLLRVARARRKDDRLRPESPDGRNVKGIVSTDKRLFSKLFQVTGKVVDEAVVVVDEEDHESAPNP